MDTLLWLFIAVAFFIFGAGVALIAYASGHRRGYNRCLHDTGYIKQYLYTKSSRI